MSKKTDLATKFWLRVQKTDGCWLWTRRGQDGYGVITIGTKSRFLRAHRISWELHYGAIPDGLGVLHHCDNPPCVRPDHLFLGTALDNARDRESKGRGRYLSGEQNGRAKLTLAQVIEIRTLYAQGNITQAELRKQFPVSSSQMSRIVNGQKWGQSRPNDSDNF